MQVFLEAAVSSQQQNSETDRSSQFHKVLKHLYDNRGGKAIMVLGRLPFLLSIHTVAVGKLLRDCNLQFELPIHTIRGNEIGKNQDGSLDTGFGNPSRNAVGLFAHC